jgi:hypothetical protein
MPYLPTSSSNRARRGILGYGSVGLTLRWLNAWAARGLLGHIAEPHHYHRSAVVIPGPPNWKSPNPPHLWPINKAWRSTRRTNKMERPSPQSRWRLFLLLSSTLYLVSLRARLGTWPNLQTSCLRPFLDLSIITLFARLRPSYNRSLSISRFLPFEVHHHVCLCSRTCPERLLGMCQAFFFFFVSQWWPVC